MPKGSTVSRVAAYGDGSIVYKHGRPVVITHDSQGSRGQSNAHGIAAEALAARIAAGVGIFACEALAIRVRFYTGRPKNHYGTGRNAGVLKNTAPARPAKKPDVDKLERHLLDALTGVIYQDDGQIVDSHPTKWFADDGPPRTEVEVWAVEQQTVGVVVADDQLELMAA